MLIKVKSKTTSELIAELREESGKFTDCALVVGTVEESDFVWSHDPDPLATLSAAINKGGVPYGIIGLLTQGKTTTVYCRLLERFAGSDHFRARLQHVVLTMLENAKTKTEWQTGWLM